MDGLRKRSVRALFSSGGPLPAEAIPCCARLFGQLPLEIYGSSETGGVAWRQRRAEGDAPWTPLPGVAVRAADGILQVRSKHLPDDDWHSTADRIRMEGSNFDLVGRTDRIVKIEEKRVSLDTMEQSLLASGLLEEVRIVMLPGARLLLGVAAVPGASGWALREREGKPALSKHLRNTLSNVVDANALPRRWRYVWSLPRNAQSKITEAAMIALFDRRLPEARLLQRDCSTASLRLYLSPDLRVFEGHFPRVPIVPGVAQIEWAIQFGRALFDVLPRFLRLEAIKFQRIIQPHSAPDLELSLSPDRDVLRFSLRLESTALASGRIVFGAHE